jgi:hypothetical protein
MQPIQQQGRRTPSLSSARTLSTCWLLVSGFLTEIVQHIHSLRASGVRSSHAASAVASAARAFCRSSGSSCTTPPEISFAAAVMYLCYYYNKNSPLGRITGGTTHANAFIWTGRALKPDSCHRARRKGQTLTAAPSAGGAALLPALVQANVRPGIPGHRPRSAPTLPATA